MSRDPELDAAQVASALERIAAAPLNMRAGEYQQLLATISASVQPHAASTQGDAG